MDEMGVPKPKLVTLGSKHALQQKTIVDHIIKLATAADVVSSTLTEASRSTNPNVLHLSLKKNSNNNNDNVMCNTTLAFRERDCSVKHYSLNIQETKEVDSSDHELERLVKHWADIIICDWHDDDNNNAAANWQVSSSIEILVSEESFSRGVVLCGIPSVMNVFFESNNSTKESEIDNDILGNITTCVTSAELSCEKQSLVKGCGKRVIGVDQLAALSITGNQAMAVGNDDATCHLIAFDDHDNNTTTMTKTSLPTNWLLPIPLGEFLDFMNPATSPHMESLEEHVDTDFVIADDVLPEAEALKDKMNADDVNTAEVFPKIVAAGRMKALQLQPIVDKVIELSGSERPKILYIGTASFDRTDKFHLCTKKFREMGCEIRRLDVSEDDTVPSMDEMHDSVVEWAEVIMCSGGNTLHALIRWKEVGLDQLIKEASMKGTVLCGGSAGAGCWFSSLHTDSLRPDNAKNKEHVLNELSEEELADWDYTQITGLGFVDAMCVPHFDTTGTNDVGRAEDAEKMLQEDPSTPAIGVDENAAFVVVGNEAHAVSGDGKATCHVVVPDRKHRRMKSAPLPTNWDVPIPMDEVLEFPVPATGDHLDALEDHVDTNFIIADDVIPSSNNSVKSDDDESIEVYPKIVASGNEGGMLLQPIIDKVIELSGVKCPNVLYIGTASFDRTDKFLRYTTKYSDMGCEVRRLDVSESDTVPTSEEMREFVVDWPHVIMCSGGNTLHALIRWKEVGLDQLIKEASMKGTVLCGGSAGAGCWFSSLHTDSLRPDNAKNKEHVLNELSEEELADWDYAKISGLGFIDAMCVPHFDTTGTNGIKRADDAEKMMQEDPSTPAIGVDNNAALVVVGNEAQAVSGDGKATVHVVVPDRKHRRMKSAPLPTNWDAPIPIDEILDFPEPAMGVHMESLEEHVDTDFVIADDVIQENSIDGKAFNVPKIVAAGNEGGMILQPIIDKVIELSGVKRPNVLYIGTASFDRTDKFNRYTKAYSDMGCEIRRLDVSEDDTVPSMDEMRECVVNWPHVIMCAGGNTLHALIRWKEVGLDQLIKEASIKGKVLCGGSAGMLPSSCVFFCCIHTHMFCSTYHDI